MQLDETDKALIAALRDNARTPVADLARRTGIARTTVQARIDRLCAQGVIAGFTLRAGAAPEQPDNVVQPFVGQRLALYASRDYVERHGMLQGQDDMVNHRFVASDNENTRAPFERWLRATIPAENIVFRCSDAVAGHKAIRAGAGIGFISLWEAANSPDLVMMMDPRDDWSGKIWLVTHVDLHRTNKVQSFVRFLKEHAKGWPQ